jgi:hypothetical protein
MHTYILGIRKVYLSQKKNVKKWTDSEGFKDTSEWIVETDGMYVYVCMHACMHHVVSVFYNAKYTI